jgi:hypothetical protein
MPPPPPDPNGGGTFLNNEGWWCPNGWCDPLILDLNGDGVKTTGPEAPVWFDIDGSGRKEHVTWTNSLTSEGFLWIDLHHDNRVDDGSELFGIGTTMPDGTKAANGFQALAVYDTTDHGGNGDGVIDVNDAVWHRLRLWIDWNHNGICEPGETGSLEEYGIVRISLSAVQLNLKDPAGNIHSLRGSYTRRVPGSGLSHYIVDSISFRIVR